MDLYFLTLDDLDRPIHKVDNKILFTRYPFFNDYYIVILLKKVTFPESKYIPVILNDRELVTNYGAQNLAILIEQVIGFNEQIYTSTFKISYSILMLKNDWWCIYIEKRYIWDRFQSLGIITIMATDKNSVLEYFCKYFAQGLIKKSKLNLE